MVAVCGGEVLRPASLSTDPGKQEDRARHQLAQPRQEGGLGRADDRAQPAEPRGRAGEAIGALGDDLREALVQRPVGSREVEDVGGAGIRRAHEQEDPGAGLRRRVDQRLEGVGTEQRVGGERVGAEALDGPPRGRRLPDKRLAVGGRGDRDVAALAVGDREQPGVVRGSDAAPRRLPPRRAEALEAGELELDRDAGRPGALDQLGAVRRDGAGSVFRGRIVGAVAAARAELGRIGVEPEDDLAAAVLDRRREPVGKGLAQISP